MKEARIAKVVNNIRVQNPSVPEYFALVNGEEASLNQIRAENHYMDKAVESLHKLGEVIGQHVFEPQVDGTLVFDVRLLRIHGVNRPVVQEEVKLKHGE